MIISDIAARVERRKAEAIRRIHGVPEVRPPAPRTVAWWLLLDEEKLKDTDVLIDDDLDLPKRLK